VHSLTPLIHNCQ